jgi:hypothetical protein
VTNPHTTAPSETFLVYVNTTEGALIDKKEAGLIVTMVTPGIVANGTILADSSLISA